jgi:hypothetical protein
LTILKPLARGRITVRHALHGSNVIMLEWVMVGRKKKAGVNQKLA